MPRPRTGSVYLHGDHFDVQITLPGGVRSKRRHLPPTTTRDEAKTIAADLTSRAHKLPSAKGAAVQADRGENGETFDNWAERWCDAREERGLTSAPDDRGRLRKWVSPLFGSRAIVEISKVDLERLVEDLDDHVRAGDLSWKTARNTWGVVAKMFSDASKSKVRALRVLTANPAADVAPPDRGGTKAKAYLYPSELLAVLVSEDVPIAWRKAVVLAIFLYVRASELRALTWEDVDVERGIVHVHRSVDREGSPKATKTKIPRRFSIEPTLLPLLRAMHAAAEGIGRVAVLPDDRHLSRALKAILTKAGLTRAELFASDATRKPMTWHDLRATGITWMAIRGDDPLKIMQRAGHADFETTQIYIREAEAIRDGFGEVFPRLPASMTAAGESLSESLTNRSDERFARDNRVEAPGIETAESATIRGDSSDSGELVRERVVVTAPNPQRSAALGAEPESASEDPRVGLIGDLARRMADLAAAGDLEAARVAHRALGELLASVSEGAAGIINLAAARATRRRRLERTPPAPG